MSIFDREDGFGRELFEYSPEMQCLCLENGRILAANRQFTVWTGYNEMEFINETNPVTLFDLLVPDMTVPMLKECMKKATQKSPSMAAFRMRLKMTPKSSPAKLVELRFTRYPYNVTSEFRFFAVSIEELSSSERETALQYRKLAARQQQDLAKISRILQGIKADLHDLRYGNVAMFVKWSVEHPVVAGPIWALIAFLLFGSRVMEVFQLFWTGP